ncbi:hypothetical protein KFL_000800240 [Klebsormidium nitens]|uniref:MRPL25 domain-containing protein n=1 Tax=Klebsormidium nitens TaxID=105231 RepID=A0A1Y1HY44_KLENI|nr:hypothetical protein KFL_000800240 [Klebsormidium nitens]|eukprot:GAQ81446.1 hypothetical protein KFL_000800240 [Klebsormidium nitens]
MAAGWAQNVKALASKLRSQWIDGKWIAPKIKAREAAKLKRETLLSGREWPHDPPRKEMKNIMKGHKHDRIAAERRKKIEETMARMPQIIADFKAKKAAEKLKAKKKD